MTKKQKKMLIRIIIAAVLLIALNFIPVKGILRMILFLIPYLVIGYDILKKAGKGILNRQVFDENFLMAVATIGAIAIAIYDRSGNFNEAVAVMLFYQIGELFQSYAVGKSRRNISELMDIRPDYANIEQDGKLERVDPDEVEIGTVIVVQPGEKVPIDGIVIEGTSTLNTSALTGESLPRETKVGDEIISGCINMTGVLKIRTIKEFGTGRKFNFKKIQIRGLYFKVCKILYPGSVLWGIGTGNPSSVSPYAGDGSSPAVGYVDLSCVDIPCNQLPVCIGHQYSAEFLCRNRWSESRRCAGEGIKLS